jgi:hypothetical protein
VSMLMWQSVPHCDTGELLRFSTEDLLHLNLSADKHLRTAMPHSRMQPIAWPSRAQMLGETLAGTVRTWP